MSVSSESIISFDKFNQTTYFAIDGNDDVHFIDQSTNAVVSTLSSNLGSYYVIGELNGPVSVIVNSGQIAEILFFDLDSDGDGVTDVLDDFPNDSTQQYDTDEDGFGDNKDGLNGDFYPNNPISTQIQITTAMGIMN